MPEARERHVYLVAHYDSRASEPLDADSDAPGANDDASGVAALLEAARVLSSRRHDATLVFLAVAGEEQGLYGSRLHAGAARAAARRITAVLSNDIVGDPTGPGGAEARDAIRVFSEGVPRAATLDEVRRVASLGGESDSPSRQLARYVEEVAERHGTRVRPRLVFRPDRFLRGGDHTAFNERGIAAVRFTDVHETWDRQHQDVRIVDGRRYGDLPEFVDERYLADVARLDVTVLAHLANAPAPPADARIVVAALSAETTLRWTRSPEPDVVGYEVVRRATTSSRWEHVHDVGDAAEATLPFSKDDWLFGVRAVDRDGFRSLVTAGTG
jgi:Zn-dependent M28 family amino/carboxypeptidase